MAYLLTYLQQGYCTTITYTELCLTDNNQITTLTFCSLKLYRNTRATKTMKLQSVKKIRISGSLYEQISVTAEKWTPFSKYIFSFNRNCVLIITFLIINCLLFHHYECKFKVLKVLSSIFKFRTNSCGV